MTDFPLAGLKVLDAAVRAGCRRLVVADDDVDKGATGGDVAAALRKALKDLHLDHLEIRIELVVLFRVVDAKYPDDLRDELDVPTHDARVPASRRARRTRSSRAAREANEAGEAASIASITTRVATGSSASATSPAPTRRAARSTRTSPSSTTPAASMRPRASPHR